MTGDLFSETREERLMSEAVSSLRNDLIQVGGPRISTMRNYRFALVQYHPTVEFKLRQQMRTLCGELEKNGWVVLSISLQELLLDRVRSQGDEFIERVVAREKRTAARSVERGLQDLQAKLTPLIEGPQGIAADCSKIISEFADGNPDKIDRTLAVIGRAGALYPFFRSSALLRHLDGRTRNVPVVLLYPGERRGGKGLSFMGVLEPDSDYRPRIY